MSLVAENYFGHFGFHITSSDTETATFTISFAFAEGFSENGKLRSKTRSGKFIRTCSKQRQEWPSRKYRSRFCIAAVAIVSFERSLFVRPSRKSYDFRGRNESWFAAHVHKDAERCKSVVFLSDSKGAKVCTSCRSRQELSNEYLVFTITCKKILVRCCVPTLPPSIDQS